MSNQWDSLRKQFRQAEIDLDNKLAAYAKLSLQISNSSSKIPTGNASATSSALSPWRSAETLEMEIDSSMEKLSGIVDELSKCLERQYPSSSGTINPSMMHTLQRHRDILYDFHKEYKKSKTSMTVARENAELLGSVRQDVNQHRKGSSSMTESLLTERNRIDGVGRMTDNILEVASEARASLLNQRATLTNSTRRITAMMSNIPGINILIAKISARKRRDNIILAIITAICLLFIIFYSMNQS